MTKGQGSFSAPPQIVNFDGLLSDFDGTIVDSTDGKESKVSLSRKVLYYDKMLNFGVVSSDCEALAQVSLTPPNYSHMVLTQRQGR